jgi:hypothetical protein|nr:MAG TPA: hypothetical protein [Caudoviricetes sp.]
MTITINLTDQEAAQASKALTELIQTCAEAAQTDAPHNNNNNNNNNTVPKAKAKPKAEPAPTPQPELIEPEPSAEETPGVTDSGEAAIDYTKLRDTLKAECAAIARDGKTKALKALLADYDVEKLSELPDDKIEAFRTVAKAL